MTVAEEVKKLARQKKPRRSRVGQLQELADLKSQIDKLSQRQFEFLPAGWTREEAAEFFLLLAELFDRDSEALELYTPLPAAEAIHRCIAHEVGISGSNRAGKSVSSAAEFAMAYTGRHFVPDKWPKRDGLFGVVGMKEEYLAILYTKLFVKGLFKVFLHPKTYQWVVVQEDDPEHKQYKELWSAAPPLIPPRYLAGQPVWNNKKQQVPVSITLINGTQIRFFSGHADSGAPRSDPYDGFWIDEELENGESWLGELRARIIDRNGRIYWSTTPQMATEEFRRLEIRANDPANATKPPSMQAAFFKLRSRDNIFISKVGLDAIEDKLLDDPDQLKVRVGGEFPFDTLLVFPDFREKQNVLDESFPLRWEDTRYLAIDPGSDECGGLWIACLKPPEAKDKGKMSQLEWDLRSKDGVIVVYDELRLRNANAQVFAQQAKMKFNQQGPSYLHDITFDERAGRQFGGIGMRDITKKIGETWLEYILAADIQPKVQELQYGSSQLEYGITAVKTYHIPDSDDHLPRLVIFPNCRNLIYEFKSWRKKHSSKGHFTGYDERNHTLLDCLRYVCTRELRWIPPPVARPGAGTLKDLKKTMRDWQTGRVHFRG